MSRRNTESEPTEPSSAEFAQAAEKPSETKSEKGEASAFASEGEAGSKALPEQTEAQLRATRAVTVESSDGVTRILGVPEEDYVLPASDPDPAEVERVAEVRTRLYGSADA